MIGGRLLVFGRRDAFLKDRIPYKMASFFIFSIYCTEYIYISAIVLQSCHEK